MSRIILSKPVNYGIKRNQEYRYRKAFKPVTIDKEKKAAGQLYRYARALSFRTNIPIQNFICAWFDENHYYEFNFEK